MTILDDRDHLAERDPDDLEARFGPGAPGTRLAEAEAPGSAPADEPGPAGEEEEPAVPPVLTRPLLVAGLSAGAAGLMAGGIFGAWSARVLCAAAAAFGVGWTWFTIRRLAGRVVKQALFLPAVAVIGVALLAVNSPNASPLSLMGKAIHAGHLFRPPVPFDPGWRPLLFALFAFIGLAASWLGTALDRPQLGLVLPLPVLALTAISQPPGQQLVAGFLGLVPLLIGVGILFGGDRRSGPGLGRDFELKRLLRGAVFGGAVLVVLLILAQSNFLFPKPVYNPSQKPQKPKAVPISAASDRVLFEVASPDGSDPPITGPWVIGTLDVYDGTEWRLPPVDPGRLKPVPGDGVMDKTRNPDLTVKFTVRDLGDTSTFPTVPEPVKVSLPGGAVFDPRTVTFRVRSGRVPANTSYSMSLAKYPVASQLEATGLTPVPKEMKPFLQIPPPPPGVADLLRSAPQNPWLRLNTLLTKLNNVAVANGAGVPGPVTPAKVDQILVGNHEGTPYQIVAAEAMLARWAGVPARIGFGFDAGQKEGKVTTIRPKNAAQFLEAWFNGYGWVPIITTPPKAKTSFNTDKNKQFDPTIQPSDDVSVELEIPFLLQSLRQLYQKVQDALLTVLPFALVLLAIYLGLPFVYRSRRRAKRRRWALEQGPRQQVAVEYAEFRDLTTDLGLGDPYDTPLEFLDQVIDDEEHIEFAWLVARSLYGDLAADAGPAEAQAAMDMGDSLRRRMFNAQPLQSRVLAVISRASLKEPYSAEIPNVRLVPLRRRMRKAAARSPGGPGARRRPRPPSADGRRAGPASRLVRRVRLVRVRRPSTARKGGAA